MDLLAGREAVDAFIDSDVNRNTLGLVYGRRRIGKSTLLEGVTTARAGFYWEATRGESAVQLARLGESLGAHLGVGRLAFETWEEALPQLLRLGASGPTPIVLDEFGYLLESDPSIDSSITGVLGPAGRRANPGRARLILCGSAIAMMRSLTAGEAPLRGRAGMELVMQAFDFRMASARFGFERTLDLAARVYAVIGGVIGYATDMVDHDLPDGPSDSAGAPSERTVLAIGEAKAGETIGQSHLHRLEQARATLGTRAQRARLLLFAPAFTADLLAVADRRHDLDLVDLERLYHGE